MQGDLWVIDSKQRTAALKCSNASLQMPVLLVGAGGLVRAGLLMLFCLQVLSTASCHVSVQVMLVAQSSWQHHHTLGSCEDLTKSTLPTC